MPSNDDVCEQLVKASERAVGKNHSWWRPTDALAYYFGPDGQNVATVLLEGANRTLEGIGETLENAVSNHVDPDDLRNELAVKLAAVYIEELVTGIQWERDRQRERDQIM